MKLCIPLLALMLFCNDCHADAITRAHRANIRAARLNAVASATLAEQQTSVQYVASPVVTYRVAPVVRSSVVHVHVHRWLFW